MNSKKGIKKGITLVEALLSAVIISLVVAGILGIFVHTIDISKRIDYEYTATNIAKNRTELARTWKVTKGFDSLPDLDETDTIVDKNGVSDLNGEFKRTTAVTTNYDGNSGLIKVDVTVTYKYRNIWKSAATITMTTIFTNLD